jgi:opacity protein-like surface antigen
MNRAFLTVTFILLGIFFIADDHSQAATLTHDAGLLHPFNPPGLVRGEGIVYAGARVLDSSMDLFDIKSRLGSNVSGDYTGYFGGFRYGVRDQMELFGGAERADIDISQTFGSLHITTAGGGGRFVARSKAHGLVGSLDLGVRSHLGDEFSRTTFTTTGTNFSATITAPQGRHLVAGDSSDTDLYARAIVGKSVYSDRFKVYGLLGAHYVIDQSSLDFSLLAPYLSASDSALFNRVKQNLDRTERHYEVGLGFHVRPIDRVAVNVGWRYAKIQRQWPVGGFAGELTSNHTVEGNLDIRLTDSLHLLGEATYFQHLLLTEIPSLYNERTASRFAHPYGYAGASLRLFFSTGL